MSPTVRNCRDCGGNIEFERPGMVRCKPCARRLVQGQADVAAARWEAQHQREVIRENRALVEEAARERP